MTDNIFKWRHFEKEIILLCVRWYLKYSLSYRNLIEMMTERGKNIMHTTIMRWIHRYSLRGSLVCDDGRVLAEPGMGEFVAGSGCYSARRYL